jgi:hypothetical protein
MKTAKALLFLLCAALLGGCVHWTSVTHSTSAQSEVLTITETAHGLILGPCGLVDGGSYVAGRLTLKGRKEDYTDNDFSIIFPTDPAGMPNMRTEASGTIHVDWKRRVLKIDLLEWWIGAPSSKSPCSLNGTYDFREEKEPNQHPRVTGQEKLGGTEGGER